MWPYTIRLNPTGFIIFLSVCVTIYLLYSSSSITKGILSDLKKRKEDLPMLMRDTVNLKQILVTLVRAAEMGGQKVIEASEANLNIRNKEDKNENINEILTNADVESHRVMVHQVSATFPGLKIISEERHESDKNPEPFSDPFRELPDLLFSDDIRGLPPIEEHLENIVVWIDPLDATQEFSEKLYEYVTTMACVAVKGIPEIGVIHQPFTGKTFWGWRYYGYSESLDELISKSRQLNSSKTDEKFRIIISRSHAGNAEVQLKKELGDNIKIIPAGGSGYKIIKTIDGFADAYVHMTSIKKWDICAPNAIMNSIEGGKMTSLHGSEIDYKDNTVWNKDGILATFNKDHKNLLNSLINLKVKDVKKKRN